MFNFLITYILYKFSRLGVNKATFIGTKNYHIIILYIFFTTCITIFI